MGELTYRGSGPIGQLHVSGWFSADMFTFICLLSKYNSLCFHELFFIRIWPYNRFSLLARIESVPKHIIAVFSF